MINTVLLNISLIVLCIYSFKKIRHGLHMLQLEYYRNERYNAWIKKNSKKTFSYRDLLLLVSSAICIVNIRIGLIITLILSILLYYARNIYQEKKAFVVTGRVKRIYIVEFIAFAIIILLTNLNIYSIFIADLLVIFAYYFVKLLNTVNLPIERTIQNKFIKKAKNKLKQMNDLKIIGLTGSYGKTSTKYIVSTILNQKYNVLKTPKSYNTQMGIVKTINESLKPTDQVFVCEMGASEVGNIKKLANLVSPTIGIVTSIGPQHLETFGSLENIKKTKFELADSLPDDGIAFLNYEDENIKSVNYARNKITYGLSPENDYYATETEIEEMGSKFIVHTKNNEEIPVSTKLLGEHNIINIVGAVAIAKELNLTNEQIQLGIKLLKPVEHRLELKKHANGTIIIDDAYNSNPKGAKMAVEVLGRFKNKKRILVTPGMVELGDKLYEYNKMFGMQAASNCDYVILVGEKQAEPIYDGLIEKKFDKNKIYIAKDFEHARIKMNEWMDSNTVILLENDLSDNYL